MDMEHEIVPMLIIDEFESKIGEDEDIIVLAFIIKSKEAGSDLTAWLERGYDWVLDADVSPGEVERGKYYVFAEINRRPSAPRRIMELLDDLSTLTGFDSSAWSLKIDHKRYQASKEVIEQKVPLTANDYRREQEQELNEWRDIAGIQTVNTFESDEEILAIQRQAGLK